ncbi:MAG: cobyric acid synthase [Hyphomicrobiales bacterium]|nr:cobyric acid synthase [Hyphomicrobiales bacterium]
MTHALMLQGTGSNVGKSVLVAGLCRLAKNRGLNVRPFKPQNMSNNAAVAICDDGSSGEIGRAQWLQAMACGVPPHVDMNPVLLKPQSETGSQIIVRGKLHGSAGAREYQAERHKLLGPVIDSFERLKNQADLVLVEGAGSPAEINLRQHDIANMGFALGANVPVVLVGDIDRGGVIASLVGTHTILEAKDRKQIKGFLVNRFRGDVSLFDEGRKQIVSFTGWQDFGVLPWLDAVSRLPEEDSVWFGSRGDEATNQSGGNRGSIKIAIPVFSRIANFDDFDPLVNEDDVNLVFVTHGQNMPEDADLVILAGSKSTIGDMAEMEENGWAGQIRRFAGSGGQVIGICGGYQMLGTHISDPQNAEGKITDIAGLGLLDVKTVLEGGKTVRISEAVSNEFDVELNGYEIHLGVTTGPDCGRPMIRTEQSLQGACSPDGRIRGCYLHGLFGNDAYRANIIRSLGGKSSGNNHLQAVEEALDELAGDMEKYLDIDPLLQLAS